MSNPYKNKNLITSLMEIPELANFDQIATFKMHFESWDNFFFDDVMDWYWDVTTIIPKQSYFKGAWSS